MEEGSTSGVVGTVGVGVMSHGVVKRGFNLEGRSERERKVFCL